MNKILISITLAVFSTSVIAGGIYTPKELNQMIRGGKYPAQGKVVDTQTTSLSFYSCKAVVEKIMSQLRGIYPVETIVDTNIMHMTKAWTNDGAVTATCSQPDRKMVLTRALYK